MECSYGNLSYHYTAGFQPVCVSVTPQRVKACRAKDWIINMANEKRGKDYIISMFMESIYLHRKYWQQLRPVDLG